MNVTDVLNALSAASKLRPFIGSVVEEVESLFPDLAGNDKLNHALETLDIVLNTAENVASGLADIYAIAKPALPTLIAAAVKLRKLAGIFKAKSA